MSLYPYRSHNKNFLAKLRKGQDYTSWQKVGLDLQEKVSKQSKPIIEIGGPTPGGFFFLDNITLSSKPVITNISSDPLPYSKEASKVASQVSGVFDARKMSYENDSVGIFLMSGMSITSDWYMELPENERDKQAEKIEQEFDIARLEMEQVALGTLKPRQVKYAQRLQIYLEVSRTLAKGGLLFSDGSLAEIVILQSMGFELLAYTQEIIRPEQNGDNILYEFVVQK